MVGTVCGVSGHVGVILNARVTCLFSKISPSSVPSALRLDSPGCINGRSVGEWVSQPLYHTFEAERSSELLIFSRRYISRLTSSLLS